MKEELEIQVKTGDVQRSFKEIKQQLKDIRSEMLNLDGDEFLEAAKKAGELQHELQEVNESIRGASSDFGDMLGNISKAGAGITGAFQVAAGALNLFGMESEDVAKAIQKMQSIMAMTQGLSAIDEGIKSFKKLKTSINAAEVAQKALNLAMSPAGIGLAIAAIGGLTLAFTKLKDPIDNVTEAQKAYNDEVERSNTFNQGQMSRLLELQQRLAKLQDSQLSEYDKYKKEYAEAKIIYEQALLDLQELEKTKPVGYDDVDALVQYNTKWMQINTTLDGTKSKMETLKELINITKPNKDVKRDDNLFEGVSPLDSIATQVVSATDIIAQGIDEMSEQVEERSYRAFFKMRDWAKDSSGQIAQTFATSAQLVGQTLNAIASAEDTSTKEGFERNKKMQISAAVMNMLGGVVAAISSCWSPANAWQTSIGQAVTAALTAASIIATGTAQIASISKQKFGSTSGIGSSRAAVRPSATALSSPVQYTRDVQGAEIAGTLRDTRVYVTETDITDTQRKVNLAESESTF